MGMALRQVGAHQTELHLPDRSVFFSYETPVILHYPAAKLIAVTAQWHSRTTAKHIGQWLRTLDGAQHSMPQELLEYAIFSACPAAIWDAYAATL